MNQDDNNSPTNEEKNATSKCSCTDRYLKEFLDDNTIAGINHVFRGKSKVRRMIWAVIFISSIIGCIALISLTIQYFIGKPTATTVNIVSQEGARFPSVTICNINFEMDESRPLTNRTYDLMNNLFNADESFHSDSMNTSSILRSCNRNVPTNNNDVRFTATIWRIQRPQAAKRAFIYYCGFVDGVNGNVSFCEDYFEPILTPAGICFTFNGSDKLIRSTGTRYGMKLVLNIEKDKRPSYNGKSGVILSVHDGKDVARPNVNGINVAPGQAIDVGVSQKQIIDNTQESNCSTGQRLTFFEQYDYSQYACAQNTLIEHIAQSNVCNCTILPGRPANSPYVNTPNCTFPKSCCLLTQYRTVNAEEKCPIPCSYKYYDYTTSFSSFPNGFYLEDLMTKLGTTSADIKENFLSINIFINDLRYTTITTEYTFGIEALLGEIGGQLGLFIGVSIITFFEVLVLCLDEFKRICCTQRIKKKIKKMIASPNVDSSNSSHAQDNAWNKSEKPTKLRVKQ